MDTVEELIGLLQQQTEINTELVRGQQDALVDQNIAKSPGGSTFGDRVSPKLSSPEIRRANEVSNIFIKNFFDAEKRLKPDKKEKTLTSSLFKRADKAKECIDVSWGIQKFSYRVIEISLCAVRWDTINGFKFVSCRDFDDFI